MDSHSFDLLVIGAGPAGCAAAIRAVSRGVTVGIIERAAFPRDLPGEALHPDIDSLFGALGVTSAVADAGFIKMPGWILERKDESAYVPFSQAQSFRFGYQAWRADLDAILLAEARRSGADVFPETAAESVLLSDGRVTGIQTTTQSMTMNYVIDASGARRWLSRKLCKTSRKLSPKLVARYGYSSKDFGLGNLPIFREHEYGWTWLAKVRNDICQCVHLSLTPDTEVPALPETYGFPSKLRGADVSWRLLHECAGPGYFICGDAAATLDPASSGGVARALESGIKAGDLVADIHDGETNETEASNAYREWLTGKIESDARQLASRHSVLQHAPRWVTEFEEI